MSLSDPIADFLTRIRNASLAKHQFTYIPNSKIKFAIAQIFKEEGYIKDCKIIQQNNNEFIWISLKYNTSGKSIINEIKKISKPGRRKYVGYKEIPWTKNGFGISLLTTSKGIISDKKARKEKIGGELLCSIW